MNKIYFSVNNWLADLPSGSIIHTITGERKRLGEYQLNLLEVFIQNAGVIFTREELTALVWERRIIGNNSLPNAIHALRVALEDDGKQQRIIKTIPKKGYFLNADYCRQVMQEESDISDNSASPSSDALLLNASGSPNRLNVLPENATVAPTQASGISEEMAMRTSSVPENVPAYRYRHLVIALVMVILFSLISCCTMWYFLRDQQSHLTVKEQEIGVYSNIRLYKLSFNNQLNNERLYPKLREALSDLNQKLEAQSISMNIYYQTTSRSLKYTISLRNQCDSERLTRTIYHWRLDYEQLTDLIQHETRKKMDEMTTCNGR